MKDEGTPQPTQGGGDSSITTPLGGEGREGRRKRIISSGRLLEMTKDTLNAPLSQLWGYHIRPKMVTLLVGETSAGKTTLLHNLAYHLASGVEFIGVTPSRPLRVLYLDYESGEEIVAEHLSAIGIADGWDFVNLSDTPRGTDLTKILEEEIRAGAYDVVIMDSLMEAYPVNDENDNPEAAKQMLTVRKLAHDTGAAIVVVHNAGQKALAKKKRNDAKNLSRGASARMDKADVVLNYTINGPKDSDERVLEVVKTRGRNLNEKIIVRFAGDLGFEVVEGAGDDPQVIKVMETKVLDVVQTMTAGGDRDIPRAAILVRLAIEQEDKRGSQVVDRALKNLVQAKKLSKVSKGMYVLGDSGAVGIAA